MLTIEKLNAFGADTKTGLTRCVNNEALYLRLVGMVPTNNGFNSLYEAIKNNDLDGAFSAAHGLKGILANLALSPLSDPVVILTDFLRMKKDVDYSPYLKEIEEKRKELEELCK